MPLLKQNPAAVPKAVVLDLTDLGRQAGRLREQVKAEAEAVLAAAREEAAGLGEAAEAAAREAGFEAGRAEGMAAGEAAGREEARAAEAESLQAAGRAWAEAAGRIEAARGELALEAESAVLKLAVALAEKVVSRHLETHPDAAVDAVREAVAHVLDPVALTVRLHPGDVGVVEAALPDVLPAERGAVRVVAEEQIGRGGCVVEHGAGAVDATIDTKLKRLSALLLGDSEDAEPEQEG